VWVRIKELIQMYQVLLEDKKLASLMALYFRAHILGTDMCWVTWHPSSKNRFFLDVDASYFGNLGEATLFNKSRLALNVLITHTLR
jgi:hypothetical protein